jgi:putative YhbY family RNA-binding protein
MPEIQLTPKERQALKAQAHGLKPVVLLGSAGLSPSVVKEIDRALLAHELIKVKVPGDDRAERDEIFTSVAESLSAARVQAIGKLLVLYRPAPDEEGDPAPTRTGSRKMTAAERSPKAPARGPVAPRTRDATPARTKAGRTEVQRVNRGTAPRHDPGTARRAVGRTNAPKGGRGK